MDVRLYDDRTEFAGMVGELYSADPVLHTTALTVLARYLDDPAIDPVMLTVHRGGELYGAAFRTPPWSLLTSALPTDAAAVVADVLAGTDPALPGVNGPRARVDGFARAWSERTGMGVREVMLHRLYELRDLDEPAVPGHARAATVADFPLLVRWRRAFQLEAMGHDRGLDGVADVIRRGMAEGDRHQLWEAGGEPVSWAHAATPMLGMSRVGPVYTPPERRGRGYGSAVTATVSRWAREAGARRVVLFADLANPTSNFIYQRIGYRPLFDACELEFTAAR